MKPLTFFRRPAGMSAPGLRGRRALSALLGAALILPLVVLWAQSGDSFSLRRAVIAGGGGSSTGAGEATMESTIGQAAAGSTLSSGQFTLQTGFWVATPGKLLNISTRLRVLTGENVLIGGFIITGSEPKQVLLRAIGPSLARAGVQGALADPTLELFQGETQLASNNNWKETQEGAIAATGIPPTDDRESAILRTLGAGNSAYTAIVRGTNETTGIGLVEAYDLGAAANSQLANISTRGRVDTGENVLIGGFILAGGSSRIVVRGIGPSLRQAGIEDALSDPTLELYDGNGTIVAANDNWKEIKRVEIGATGLAPANDFESVILENLAPGAYTAILAGKDNGTGVGLVEAYNLQ